MKPVIIAKNILNERDTTLNTIFKSIRKYPVLSGEEQIELAKKALEGDDKAREELITCNLRFVVTCAKQYVNCGVPLIDLIQSGIEGLCLSIDHFDPTKGVKFISFSVWYIRREILKAIYNTGRTVRYPVTYISKLGKMKKICDRYMTELQREPTEEEVVEFTNFTHRQYKSTILDKSYCQSLDAPSGIEGYNTIGDTIASNESISDDFRSEIISNCLNVLTPREKEIILEYYGLEGHIDHSIKEIASTLDVGEERVRQIRKNAVKKLKQRCGNILKNLL